MERGEEERAAFYNLKQALLQAPAFVYPQAGKPYLQLETTNCGLSAILLQQQGTSLKPVVLGSKVLPEIEKRYSACECDVLALTSVYLTGIFPIVLRTVHTLIKYVLSGKANERQVPCRLDTELIKQRHPGE